jgi:ABC-type sugar transport system ATPase subunit
MAKIELKNVKKSYGSTAVLKGVDLEIPSGSFTVFVGPSGCGKSTMLRLIAGLEELNEGDILMDGKSVRSAAPGDRQIAMVFQDYALYPHMSVYENMAFGLRIKKVPQSEIDKRIDQAATILKIKDFLRRKPHMLSGGQRQRVAMGRALVKEARAFLFDEPLSNLDANLRNEMRVEIKRLHRLGKTTSIYVTHDQVEAMTLADQLVVLNRGQIEQVGSPMEIFERPKSLFVAQFMAHPQINLLRGQTVRQGHEWRFVDENKTFSWSLPESKTTHLQDGSSVLLAIRPSDVYLGRDSAENVKQWQFDGVLDVVEPLGKNAFLTFALPGKQYLTGEIMGRGWPAEGDKVAITANLNHAFIFSADGSRNLELT